MVIRPKKVALIFAVLALGIATQHAFAADQKQHQIVPEVADINEAQAATPRVIVDSTKKDTIVEAKSAAVQQVAPIASVASAKEEPKSDVATPKSAAKDGQTASEDRQRKGRADEQGSPSALTSAASNSGSPSAVAAAADKIGSSASVEPTKAAATDAKPSTPATGAKLDAKASKPVKANGLNKAASKKSNLGTVTSTGSGGPYLSKHDSYSAIAERHLFTDAMRKSDRRRLQSSGIDKASSIGNMFGSMNGITDNGLARTIGASMRSMMKSKYSVPAYVASALLGAVALLAFYESPISPLPVPPLPEPPVGRFPPEMPNISPNIQVPFRVGGQQQYGGQQYGSMQDAYQRSYNQQQQQSSSVLFPGASQVQASSGSLASSLLSSAKPQIAQRKSSPDYDLQSSSRSLFGSSMSAPLIGSSNLMSVPPGQKADSSKGGFLSFLGFGGGSGSTSPSVASATDAFKALTGASHASSGTSSLESKGTTSQGLSNSHFVNKVRSMFRASAPGASPLTSSSLATNANNLYEPYKKMSFVQSLTKDMAFLPAFLAPTRKSSTQPKLGAGIGQPQIAERNGQPAQASNVAQSGLQSQPSAAGKQSPSPGLGLMKAADRFAHALLETLSAGIMQKHPSSAGPSPSVASVANENVARKSGSGDDSVHKSALASLTDIFAGAALSQVAPVNSVPYQVPQQQTSPSQQSASPNADQIQSLTHQQHQTQQAQLQPDQVSARSDSSSSMQYSSSSDSADASHGMKQSALSSPASSIQSSSQQQQVRKTRSIGLEYPVDQHSIHQYQQQIDGQQQYNAGRAPTKAAQINNVIDFVADSYTNNKLLFKLVMNQVGFGHAVPYFEQIFASNEHVH